MSHKWQRFLFHISVCYQHLCCKHLSHKLNQIYLKLFNVSVHKNFTLNVQRLASQSEDQCVNVMLLILMKQNNAGWLPWQKSSKRQVFVALYRCWWQTGYIPAGYHWLHWPTVHGGIKHKYLASSHAAHVTHARSPTQSMLSLLSWMSLLYSCSCTHLRSNT